MLAIVIGGAGGIGAALVKRLLCLDHVTHVVATWHKTPPPAALAPPSQNTTLASASTSPAAADPLATESVSPRASVDTAPEAGSRVTWMQLDVADESSYATFNRELSELRQQFASPHSGPGKVEPNEAAANQADSQRLAVGLVINTVGVLHSAEMQPEKSLRSFKAVSLAKSIETNCLPTLLLAQSLAPLLKSAEPAVFACVSARVGSISDNHLGGWYSYRISKAALNMALRSLAIEWGRSHKNVCVAALHPGTTATALSEPFQKNVAPDKLFDSDTTARYLLEVIASLNASKSGRFWAWDGTEIPW